MLFDVSFLNYQTLSNQKLPPEGPKALTALFDFTAGADYEVSLVQQGRDNQFTILQTVFVDASEVTSDITFTFGGTNQKIVAKLGTQGYYPVLCPAPIWFTVNCADNMHKVPMQFLNVPIPGVIWSV